MSINTDARGSVKEPTEFAQFERINYADEISKLNVTAVHSRLIVKEFVYKNKTTGGIFLPPSAREGRELQTNCGIILSIGQDVENFKSGDLIYYGLYSGVWCQVNRAWYRILNEPDVVCKINDDMKGELLDGYSD